MEFAALADRAVAFARSKKSGERWLRSSRTFEASELWAVAAQTVRVCSEKKRLKSRGDKTRVICHRDIADTRARQHIVYVR